MKPTRCLLAIWKTILKHHLYSNNKKEATLPAEKSLKMRQTRFLVEKLTLQLGSRSAYLNLNSCNLSLLVHFHLINTNMKSLLMSGILLFYDIPIELRVIILSYHHDNVDDSNINFAV